MFTGLVEAMGEVERVAPAGAGWRLVLRVPTGLAAEAAVGDSVAVSGACLTVVEAAPGRLAFDLAEETLRVTTLGGLTPGEPVNLERPLRVGAPLGGHWVLGHVDGVGRVSAVAAEGAGQRVTIEVPPGLRPLLIPKGSVAVDGVSLTVAGLHESAFSVALIPHTLGVTTLGRRRVGAPVNLEMDVLGKYVRALLQAGEADPAALAGRRVAGEGGLA
jgi:riboflavin synthase alpha subunit